MENTTHLELVPERITKAAIKEKADMMMDLIDEGHYNVLTLAVRLKYFKDMAAAIEERMRRYVLDDLGKYPKGQEIVHHNALFTAKDAGVRYDFTGCGDPQWDDLNDSLNSIKAKMKEREKLLRSIKGSMTIVDEATGEVCTVYEPVRTATPTYQMEWKD